jgi:hypothetical protein
MSMRDSADEDCTGAKALQELADRIMEADGIVPLKAGESRPPGYYLADHYWSWGKRPLPPRKDTTKR